MTNAIRQAIGAAALLAGFWSTSAVSALYFSYGEPGPDPTFTSFSIDLIAGVGWKFGAVGGPDATATEIASTLSALKSLSINLDSDHQYFVDNVTLRGIGTIIAQSTFPGCDTEGWKLRGLPIGGCSSLIGNPAGSLTNGGASPSFIAPIAFLGNKSAAIELSFDLARNSFDSPGTGGFVVLNEVPEPGVVPLSIAGMLAIAALLHNKRRRRTTSRRLTVA